jgi:phage gp46-like protein
MAKDLKINWNYELLFGDLGIKNGDLITDEGLETAVIISLFTDKRAADDDLLLDDRYKERRGWWGDLINPEVEGDEIGSKLWLLDREKTTKSSLQKTDQYIKDALQWMLEDGVITKVETQVERQGNIGNDILAMQVTIYKADGREIALNYSYQWESV